jgi:hypothetical protein
MHIRRQQWHALGALGYLENYFKMETSFLVQIGFQQKIGSKRGEKKFCL